MPIIVSEAYHTSGWEFVPTIYCESIRFLSRRFPLKRHRTLQTSRRSITTTQHSSASDKTKLKNENSILFCAMLLHTVRTTYERLVMAGSAECLPVAAPIEKEKMTGTFFALHQSLVRIVPWVPITIE